MAPTTRSRPSLLRPSLFSLTWHVCTWLGLATVVLAFANLSQAAVGAMGMPLLMIAAIIVLSELRPIVMTRLVGNPVSISLAFVFAAMYLWGLYPAVILHAGAVLLSELLQRKPAWKILFNVGQDVCSVTAAWLVLYAAGISPAPGSPQRDLSGLDLWWILGSWVVYHLVNLALVSGLAEHYGQTWWESFTEEFWFYTISVLAVLALSPLVAVVAVAHPYSWTLLPLLLLPLLAVQKTAEMSRQQEHQALHDPLTGLPNRLLLTDRIEQALARSARSGSDVVVMFLDLDLFKVVNDSLGHHAGDDLLVEVAARLQGAVRSGDTLARFGGDEFVLVCDGIQPDEINALTQRITDALRDPFSSGDQLVSVTASIGVTVAGDSSQPHTLLRDADAAMYRAKERGRNQVAYFEREMHQQADVRLQDAVGLRRALDLGEFRAVYQPVMDIDSGITVGLEALIRWQDPARGLLSPGQFIGAAEETGLILPIGEWILGEALSTLRTWRDQVRQTRNLWVSVNISSRQLLSPGLVDHVEGSLRDTGIPPSALRLEITESVVMNHLEPVLDTLVALRSLGVQLAVDDFGTGYSSLAYLKRLPVSIVKIDRSFIAGLGGSEDSFDRPIVDAIIKMAHSLRFAVIAEGVETHEQLDSLLALGCRTAQGFLWSRPLAAEQVPDWLIARSLTY